MNFQSAVKAVKKSRVAVNLSLKRHKQRNIFLWHRAPKIKALPFLLQFRSFDFRVCINHSRTHFGFVELWVFNYNLLATRNWTKKPNSHSNFTPSSRFNKIKKINDEMWKAVFMIGVLISIDAVCGQGKDLHLKFTVKKTFFFFSRKKTKISWTFFVSINYTCFVGQFDRW